MKPLRQVTAHDGGLAASALLKPAPPAPAPALDAGGPPSQPPQPRDRRRVLLVDRPTLPAPATAVAQCEALHAALWLRYGDEMSKVTLCVGAAAGCGVSTVASSLAAAMARDPRARILLIDFHPPATAQELPTLPGTELVRVLDPSAPDSPGAAAGGAKRLCVASVEGNALSLFQSDDFDMFLQAARLQFDHVVIDAPAPAAQPEALVLSRKADGVVLVIESGRTRRQAALWARHQLEQAGGNLLGVVLNKRRHYIPRWLYDRL